jgi:RimJ/RimL family protein N-acetyltransferase
VSEHVDPKTGQPIGAPVDDRPARRPGSVTLAGRYGYIEKLNARHASSLWGAVKGHDAIWTYMSYGPFANRTAFTAWLAEREQLEDPLYYAAVDALGRALGVAALREVRPAMRVIEVGHVVYSPALQRTPLATEAQYLLMRYAFETLGYRRYEWRCNVLNGSSYRAAIRLGFTFEGVFRQDMIVKGRSRDTVWLSILDSEWPAHKPAFERWLAPDNFDAEGRQKASLRVLNGGLDVLPTLPARADQVIK